MSAETLADVCRFTEALVKDRDIHRLSVWFYGGEPFLFADECTTITRHLRALCGHQHVDYFGYAATNGSLIAKDKGQEFLNDLDVLYIGLAQNSDLQAVQRCYRGGQNSYKDSVDGVVEAFRAQKSIRLRVNVSRAETLYEDALALYRLLAGKFGNAYSRIRFEFRPLQRFPGHLPSRCGFTRGEEAVSLDQVTHTIDQTLTDSPWPRGNFKLPRPSVPRPIAGPGTGSELCGYLTGEELIIDPLGDLYLCNFHKNDPQFRIGNVRAGLSLFTSAPLLQAINYSLLRDKVCRKCAFIPYCLRQCHLDELAHGSRNYEECVQRQHAKLATAVAGHMSEGSAPL